MTLNEFFIKIAKEATEKFPDIELVVVGVVGDGDEAEIARASNLPWPDALDLVNYALTGPVKTDEQPPYDPATCGSLH